MPASTSHFRPLCARLLCLMGMFLACGLASAATVRAYIQPDHAQTGQVVSYVITVQNGTVQNLPQLRLPVQIAPQGSHTSSQNIEIRGNQRVISTQIAWGVASTEPGEFVIPPQEVLVNGEVLKTNEVRLVVTEGTAVTGAGDDSKMPLLQMEVGKTEFYQGEVVPITASLYVPRSVMLRRVSLIEVNKTDFAIARFPQQADATETVINGIGYTVLVYRSTLSALHPGELKVGPASTELLFDVMEEDPRQMRRALPFGMMMGASETRKLLVKSQDVKVKVLPLPGEGKPANFTGAVGDFAITATASPLDLAVGDPLAVDITVDGSGNFEGLQPPSLTPPDGWKAYPPRRYNVDGPVDPNLPPTAQRRVGYSMVFVPEKIHTQLPPFELSYFSPTQKKYVTASTPPIALKIKAGVAAAGTTDVTNAAGAEPPKAPEVQQPKPNLSDILANVPAKANWLGSSITANVPLTNSSRFWIIQSVPAILVLLALLFSWFRNMQKEAAQGLRGEVRQLWQGLEQRDLDDREFLQRAAHFIHRTQPEVRDEELKQILQRYETLSFTATHGGATAALPKEERSRILERLATLMRGVTVWAVLLTVGLMSTAAHAADEAPDEVYRQAREALDKGKFNDAQYLAESLTKRTPPALSAEVFALIGNARYRKDDLGRAALWYQRSQLLNPFIPEVRQNLRHLDEKLRFFHLGASSPLTEWSLLLGKNTWIMVASAGVWLMLLAIVWRVLAGRSASTGLLVVFIGLGFLVFVPSAALAAVRPEPEARVKDIMVVTTPSISAYSSATQTSGSVIDLPVGSQIRLLEKRGAWSYVEIPSGTDPVRGWVEASSYTPLWPWAADLVP